MARRSDHTRDEIRAMALTAASEILTRHGPAGLTTRAVAAKISYTVGSLYLVFRNLDDLILHVNARSLDDLYLAMQAAQADCRQVEESLLALAYTYIRFAFEHPARWKMIFERPRHGPPPDWYSERVERMFAIVEKALTVLAVNRSAREIRQAARALWGGVHGICVLELTGRLDKRGSVSVQELARSLVTHYVASFTRGSSLVARGKRKNRSKK